MRVFAMVASACNLAELLYKSLPALTYAPAVPGGISSRELPHEPTPCPAPSRFRHMDDLTTGSRPREATRFEREELICAWIPEARNKAD
jgi:hypothetical protein